MAATIVLCRAHIVDQHRFFARNRFPDNAFADAETAALRFRRMADLEAHPQVVGAVVQQKDGKDAVIDDGADQLRGLVHDGLQVEGGVECVRQPHEKCELDRLRAHLRAGRRSLAGGPIISFEAVRRPVVGPFLLAVILHKSAPLPAPDGAGNRVIIAQRCDRPYGR